MLALASDSEDNVLFTPVVDGFNPSVMSPRPRSRSPSRAPIVIDENSDVSEEEDQLLDRMPGGTPWPPPPPPPSGVGAGVGGDGGGRVRPAIVPASSIPSIPRRLHLGRWGTWTFAPGDPPSDGLDLVVLPREIAPDWVGVDVDLPRGLRGRVVWMGHAPTRRYWQCLVLRYPGH